MYACIHICVYKICFSEIFKRLFYFISDYMHVYGVSVHVKTPEVSDTTETGCIGSCKLHDVSSGYRMQVLCKTSALNC